MEENSVVQETSTVQAICPGCGVEILEVEKLPEGRENEVYTCPKCDTSLGVGFRVTKIQENIPV